MLKIYFAALPLLLVGCSDVTTPFTAEENAMPLPATEVVEARLPQANLLLAHTPAQVQGWLGQPTLVRRDGRVQIFQFKNSVCVLDAYFYRDSVGADFLANHIDVRSANGASIMEENCLKGFFVEGNYPEGLLN